MLHEADFVRKQLVLPPLMGKTEHTVLGVLAMPRCAGVRCGERPRCSSARSKANIKALRVDATLGEYALDVQSSGLVWSRAVCQDEGATAVDLHFHRHIVRMESRFVLYL